MPQKSTPDQASNASIVQASPTKRFFVDMLTRDIELEDAILDLLDNCVDGVLREMHRRKLPRESYKGYSANIKFSPDGFEISDNCGGIERDVAERYAFLMGRRADDPRDKELPTVGMYGIGMKRAIFKLGRDALVRSQHTGGAFEVRIPPDWFAESNDKWELKAHPVLSLSKHHGTTIEVKRLQAGVREQFGKNSDFESQLIGKIRSHYAFIMHKGFQVSVNGKLIEPKPMKFLFESATKKNQKSISPYLYDANIDGVEVKVTVGFNRPLPTEEEGEEEMESRRSREDAGWTVICNDRVVLYCDKTRVTGWGEADVPSFHAQFIAIAGVAEFSSNDPLKLPLTTTKRGIDGSSDVYLRVKDRMREGMKIFTSHTYKWKHNLDAAKAYERVADAVEIGRLRQKIPDSEWKPTRKKGEEGRRFLPDLPSPEVESGQALIRFHRPKEQVQLIADRLLDDPDKKPSEVGGAAFDKVLKDLESNTKTRMTERTKKR